MEQVRSLQVGDRGAREQRTLGEAVAVGCGQRGVGCWEEVDGSEQSPRGLDGIGQMMLGVLVSEQKSGRCGYGSEWLERPEVLTGIEGA